MRMMSMSHEARLLGQNHCKESLGTVFTIITCFVVIGVFFAFEAMHEHQRAAEHQAEQQRRETEMMERISMKILERLTGYRLAATASALHIE